MSVTPQDPQKLLAQMIEGLAAFVVMMDEGISEDLDQFRQRLEAVRQTAAAMHVAPIEKIVVAALQHAASLQASEREKNRTFINYSVRILQDIGGVNFQNMTPAKIEQHVSHLGQIISQSFEGSAGSDTSQHEVMSDFLTSVTQMIEGAEQDVLALEKEPGNFDRLDSLFRFFHSLKGDAGLLGISNLSRISHKMEEMLENLRSRKAEFQSPEASLLLKAIDTIRDMVHLLQNNLKQGFVYDTTEMEKSIAVYLALAPVQESPLSPKAWEPHVPVLDLSDGIEILSEFITESMDHLCKAEESLLALEAQSNNPEDVNKIFRAFHSIKGLTGFLKLEDMMKLAHETETMMDQVRSEKLGLKPQVIEAVFNAIDGMRKLLALLKQQVEAQGVFQGTYFNIAPILERITQAMGVSAPPSPTGTPPKLGEILVQNSVITSEDLQGALTRQNEEDKGKKLGEILVERGVATPGQVERGLKEQSTPGMMEETVKVSVRKLDDLVDTIGELVIMGTQVSSNPAVSSSQDVRLVKDMGQLGKIIRDLQDIATMMRLVPIRPVFQKMVRLIRDVSRKAGKEITVSVFGEDTEIDKNITEMISDPLVHMVRNSIDHGIEPPADRLAMNKPTQGSVELRAYHKGGNIKIEIRDDGRGLDHDKILKRAREKGLVAADAVLSKEECWQMIFVPGFSTAEQVTDISGRGVGMDVVKRNVEQMRGSIDIQSEIGKGTVFTIRLPLTLAIIDAVILRVGQEHYIVPIYAVQEFIQPRSEQITTVVGRGELINLHGELIPLIRLESYLNLPRQVQSLEKLTGCILNSDYGKICMIVDELMGQQQIVIKSLGREMQHVRGLAGGTILGDGRVGLIMDVNGIASYFREGDQ